MYAIVEIGGHQYRVAEGDVLYVDKQHEDSGDTITFDRVLLTNDGDGGLDFGGPSIDGASVEATVLDHVKADKVIVFKKKRRKGYRKKNGHRQPMSQIKIEAISLPSGKKKKAEKKKDDKPAEKSDKQENQQLSTDMTAKEAIAHIEDTPLDQLKGFVPDSEDRVTVQRAWDDKQENEG